MNHVWIQDGTRIICTWCGIDIKAATENCEDRKEDK